MSMALSPGWRRTWLSRISTATKYGFLALLVAYALLPFYWIVITAIKPADEIFRTPPAWLPSRIVWSNLTQVWVSVPLGRYIWNSLVVGVLTSLVSVSIAGTAAYALFRFRFTLRATLLAVVLFSVTVPTVIMLVPFYAILSDLGLVDTREGLILSYVVWAVPFILLMLRGYFESSYPLQVEEAALIDGCSRLSIVWRIALPLSIPGLVTAAIFTTLLAWNEYLWASVVAGTDEIRTAAVGLQLFVPQFAGITLLGQWMAGALFITMPLLAASIYLQRYITTAYGPTQE